MFLISPEKKVPPGAQRNSAEWAARCEGPANFTQRPRQRCGQRPPHRIVTRIGRGSSAPRTCTAVTGRAERAQLPGAEAGEPSQSAHGRPNRAPTTWAGRCPPGSKQQDNRERQAPEKSMGSFSRAHRKAPSCLLSTCAHTHTRRHAHSHVPACGPLSHQALLLPSEGCTQLEGLRPASASHQQEVL